MKTRFTTIFAGFSLLICLATAGLLARSFWVTDYFEWMRAYRQRFSSITDGRVLLQVIHVGSGTNESVPLTHGSYFSRPRMPGDHGMGRPLRYAGFWVENQSFVATNERPYAIPGDDIVVPFYPLVILGAMWPAVLDLPRAKTRRKSRGQRLRDDNRQSLASINRLTNPAVSLPHNPPLERTAAAVYFTCGRASRVRRRGRSTALRYPRLKA